MKNTQFKNTKLNDYEFNNYYLESRHQLVREKSASKHDLSKCFGLEPVPLLLNLKIDWIRGYDDREYLIPISVNGLFSEIPFLPSDCDYLIKVLKNLRDNFTDEWCIEYNINSYTDKVNDIKYKVHK